jgi:hypothetical protein
MNILSLPDLKDKVRGSLDSSRPLGMEAWANLQELEKQYLAFLRSGRLIHRNILLIRPRVSPEIS